MPFIKQIAILARKVSAAAPQEPEPSPNIEGGVGNSLVVKTTGRVFTWGLGFYGALGNNSTNSQLTPVAISGATKTFCRISVGEYFTVAIDKNGKAWGWGNNSSGQLGNNSTISRLTPVSVFGTKTFCQIAAGHSGFSSHALGIDKNGRVWSWGVNSNGQLGDSSITSRLTPVSVAGTVKTFCKIEAGSNHSLAIDKNGRAWTWGLNTSGQLGDNSTTQRNTPVSVLGTVKTFCRITANGNFSLAIDKNGRAWAWGANNVGQLGDNTATGKCTPISVLGAVKTFCRIAGGTNHSLAIDKNGRVWAWGFNGSGQLGDNTITQRRTPVSVAGVVKTFCDISAGGSNSFAIDKNGNGWAWGDFSNGYLGAGNLDITTTPLSIRGTNKTFCQIAVAGTHTIAINNYSSVWSWGYGAYNGLGAQGAIVRSTPATIYGSRQFYKIASGYDSSHGIDGTGLVWSWGRNIEGQLGDNTTTQRCTPVSIAGNRKTFCEISGGNFHTLAITQNGIAWSWGYNNDGQLGDNSTTQRNTPVSVLGTVKTFCKILASFNHSLALDKNGRLWSWGNNLYGTIGDNTTTNRCTPVSVAGAVKTFCQIATGAYRSFGIDKNGRVWSWGLNSNGELGDNTTLSRRTPVSILGAVKTFCKIGSSFGGAHHAIDKNGRLWGWGQNSNGEIGDGTTNPRRTPVSVAGAVKTFCHISAGNTFVMAIDKNGGVWGWGNRLNGQIANNTTVYTPIRICTL